MDWIGSSGEQRKGQDGSVEYWWGRINNNYMKYEYSASEGSILSKSEALVVGPILAKIQERDGCILPPAVIDEGKSKTSPLYRKFIWDDHKAAHEHRLWQARQIIRSVIIIPVEDVADDIRTVRAFVNVRSTEKETRFKGKGYIATLDAMSDVEYRAQILQNALDDANTFKARYEAYKELSDIFAGIKKAEKKVEKVIHAAKKPHQRAGKKKAKKKAA